MGSTTTLATVTDTPEEPSLPGTVSTTFICDQCRSTDFEAGLDYDPPELHHLNPMVVAERVGLDPRCIICALFADMNRQYKPVPIGEKPWKLCTLSLRGSITGLDTTRRLFSPVPAVMVYVENGEFDFMRHLHHDWNQDKGLLAYARTRDLADVAAGKYEKTESYIESRFIHSHYDHSLVLEWLKVTEKNYPTDEAVDIPGMKVIDCQTLRIVHRTPQMKYVALSYVWRLAGNDQVKLRRGQGYHLPASLTAGSLPENIPRVVQNAITVTTDLNYRYLWVDQFCIDQTPGNKELLDQISKMDMIYTSAQLTIIAANSQGALPGVGDTPRTKQTRLEVHWTRAPAQQSGETTIETGITFFTVPPVAWESIEKSTWYHRGWCFQESLLSPRQLYFTDHQMLFQADRAICCESYPRPDPATWDTMEYPHQGGPFLSVTSFHPSLLWPKSWQRRLKNQSIVGHWSSHPLCRQIWEELGIYFRLLEIYLEKDLTKGSDSLNAFQGVIQVFSRADPNCLILAGIPVLHVPCRSGEKEINQELSEFRNITFGISLSWAAHLRGYTFGQRRHQFPSWSWADWEGPVFWDEKPRILSTRVKKYVTAGLAIKAVEDVYGEVWDWTENLRHSCFRVENSHFLLGEGNIIPKDKIDCFCDSNGSGWVISGFQFWVGHKRRVVQTQSEDKEKTKEGWEEMRKLLEDDTSELIMMFGQENDDRLASFEHIGIDLPQAHKVSLLLVSWEAGGIMREYRGHKYRTCSRIGRATMIYVPGDRAVAVRRWPKVRFRLG